MKKRIKRAVCLLAAVILALGTPVMTVFAAEGFGAREYLEHKLDDDDNRDIDINLFVWSSTAAESRRTGTLSNPDAWDVHYQLTGGNLTGYGEVSVIDDPTVGGYFANSYIDISANSLICLLGSYTPGETITIVMDQIPAEYSGGYDVIISTGITENNLEGNEIKNLPESNVITYQTQQGDQIIDIMLLQSGYIESQVEQGPVHYTANYIAAIILEPSAVQETANPSESGGDGIDIVPPNPNETWGPDVTPDNSGDPWGTSPPPPPPEDGAAAGTVGAVVAGAIGVAVAAGVSGAAAAGASSGSGQNPSDKKEEEKKKQKNPLRLVVYKDFGDILIYGADPKPIYAHIMEKPPDAPEHRCDDLTQTIQITSCGAPVTVKPAVFTDGRMRAMIEVTSNGAGLNNPGRGAILFTYSHEGVLNRYQLSFKLDEPRLEINLGKMGSELHAYAPVDIDEPELEDMLTMPFTLTLYVWDEAQKCDVPVPMSEWGEWKMEFIEEEELSILSKLGVELIPDEDGMKNPDSNERLYVALRAAHPYPNNEAYYGSTVKIRVKYKGDVYTAETPVLVIPDPDAKKTLS
ncbi:hypothetical protein FACS1894219_04210 [Clostridia bacterium]|nr:hypothetical protein FACS1894219_04210 [Clostridia bacterium]